MAPPLIPRRLDLRAVVERKSCFLLGPRQIVSLEPTPRRVDGVSILPWADSLDRLWAGAWPEPGA